MDPKESSRESSLIAPALVAVSTAIAVALRAVEAGRKSLWLDEMHSLWAARGASVADVVERVRVDFHPPLYFLLLHFLDGSPHALRWLSIVLSLATLVPLLAIARWAKLSPFAQAVACGVYATSSYQILYGAELRAYAGLELVAVTMAWAAFTSGSSPRARFWIFALATAVGMYLHYFALLAAASMLVARAIVRRPAGGEGEDDVGRSAPLPARSVAAAALIGFAAFTPWLLTKESWIFTNAAKMWLPEPVAGQVDPPPQPVPAPLRPDAFAKAATVPLSTYVPMISSLGRPVAAPASVAVKVFSGLVLAGVVALVVRRLRERLRTRGGRLLGPLVAASIAYAVLVGVCLWAWRSVPLQYFVIGAWVWPFVLAAIVDTIERPWLRQAYAWALLGTSLAIGTCHVLGAPRENFRRAVGVAVEVGRKDKAFLTSILRQPLWYPHSLPYQVYAPDAEACEPTEVPAAGPGERRPVVVITRSVALVGATSLEQDWRTIKAGRKLARNLWIDNTIRVVVFEAE